MIWNWVAGGLGRRRDVDGAHPHGMWRGQVAGIVLEHRRPSGGDASGSEDRLEGCALGLREEAGILDTEDRTQCLYRAIAAQAPQESLRTT